MGAVAASGGYYVSMSADAIVANAGTITGSIGVVTGKLVAASSRTASASGPTLYEPTPNADAWSINQPSPTSNTRMSRRRPTCSTPISSNESAGQEDDRGGGRRDRPRPGVDRCDALERGLVDELGGLRTAITRAKVLAGWTPTPTCGL